MHALGAAVLMRGPGLGEIGEDAEADPPDGEGREAPERLGGEGDAVIGANPPRQAVRAEEALEDGAGLDQLGAGERLTGQEQAAMLLNRLEYALMNNPIRAVVQRRLEAHRLLRLGGRMRGGVALEIGCGRGVGAELILDMFGAERVDAFDLDPRMIARAQSRLRGRGARIRLWTGDVTLIPAPTATYDAVFDFGIIHHVPEWRRALAEVARVLRPGGRFYSEEVLRAAIVHPLVRRLLTHPQADRFDRAQFTEALRTVGLHPIASEQFAGAFAWVVADRQAAA